MLNLKRRTVLSALSLASLSTTTSPLWAQSATAAKKSAVGPRLGNQLRIVIPANEGGGWDQTGRALGAALVASGAVDSIEYENKGGKGGTIGLTHYAEKYNADANTLLIGGTVMVGAVALQKPAVDMSRIQPLARLTSDYLVMVVAADSPIRTIADLAQLVRTKPDSVAIAGGSAGGVDHVFSGVFTRATGSNPQNMVYLPFAGGLEVVEAVLSGKAMVGISGYSEFRDALASGKLRAIGVSSRKAIFGIPSIRDQGVNVEMANWRGVFTGKGVSTQRATEMVAAVNAAASDESWRQVLKRNRWESSLLTGNDFKGFIDVDITTAQVMAHLLKLKA